MSEQLRHQNLANLPYTRLLTWGEVCQILEVNQRDSISYVNFLISWAGWTIVKLDQEDKPLYGPAYLLDQYYPVDGLNTSAAEDSLTEEMLRKACSSALETLGSEMFYVISRHLMALTAKLRELQSLHQLKQFFLLLKKLEANPLTENVDRIAVEINNL